MSEKIEIKGDVSQAVMGNMNEAPRLHNVVNLNIGEKKKEEKVITDYQRRRINNLVKELAFITGDDQMEIYKTIIADFGLMKIKELPIDRYGEVRNLLEKWISEAKGALKSNPVEPAPPVKVGLQDHHTCIACREKEISFARLQRTSRIQVVAMIMLAGWCAWLLYKLPNNGDDASKRPEKVCYMDGKIHSIGSRIRNSFGTMEECILNDDANTGMWSITKQRK